MFKRNKKRCTIAPTTSDVVMHSGVKKERKERKEEKEREKKREKERERKRERETKKAKREKKEKVSTLIYFR